MGENNSHNLQTEGIVMTEGKKYIKTGIPGFDKLFKHGIPEGSPVVIAGGAGSGKTIFCLQLLAQQAAQGKKCYYMSFEENSDKLIKSGNLKIKRFLTSEIYYYDKDKSKNIEAMMTKEVDPLIMDLEPLTLTDEAGFKPDFIVIDSLTAISSTFLGKEQSYRFYIERLFRFFEKVGSTNFLVTETKQLPEVFSPTGVEEFLADGVIVFYNIRQKNNRETAIEVLKMRGEKHEKKVVAMQITDKGIVVHPDQEVFGATNIK